MEETAGTLRGVIVARSPRIMLPPISTLLELRTSDGEKEKIVALGTDLPVEVSVGNYYVISGLVLKKLDSLGGLFWEFQEKSEIERVDFDPAKDLPRCPSFYGTVTRVDEDFAIYEVDNNKYFVLSFIKYDCEYPELQVGDEVAVQMTHEYVDPEGRVYYVLCLRSSIDIRAKGVNRVVGKSKASLLLRCVDSYKLNIECLLWLRTALEAVQKCISDEFLKKLGASNNHLVYADILMQLLCSKKEIASLMLKPPTTKKILSQFYGSPHDCQAKGRNFELPALPISVSEYLAFVQNSDTQQTNEEFESWKYSVYELPDHRPILGYFKMSLRSRRLCLTDNCNELVVIPSVEVGNTDLNYSALVGKLVLVEKAFTVVERFYNFDELDPENTNFDTVNHKYIYLRTNLNNFKIIGPTEESFASWTKFSFQERVKQKSLMPEDTKLKNKFYSLRHPEVPLMGSYVSNYYVVLHKVLLERTLSNEVRGYVLVRSIQDGDILNAASSFLFLELKQPHTDFYELIPSHGKIELKYPSETANQIKSRRVAVPYIAAFKQKLSTSVCIPIPAYVHIFVCPEPRTSTHGVYSVSEACNDNTLLKGDLLDLTGKIVSRKHDIARFQNDKWKPAREQGVFGVPGLKSDIVLQLSDSGNVSNRTASVYFGWTKNKLYPQGLLPGTEVLISYVLKCHSESSKNVYFRWTSLSSIEILKPVRSFFSNNSDLSVGELVEPMNGPTLFPYEIAEGQSAWCYVTDATLAKCTIDAVCKHCGHPFQKGICSYAGCYSPLGPKIKASARVFWSTLRGTELLFVADENVQVLLGLTDSQWETLLGLANENGGLRYFGKGKGEGGSLEDEVFTVLCDTALGGKSYHCYCRRFKSSDTSSANSIFCINLQKNSLARTFQWAQSIVDCRRFASDFR